MIHINELKISFVGRFELGSDSNLFQRIKLGRYTKFQADITICTIDVIRGLIIQKTFLHWFEL